MLVSRLALGRSTWSEWIGSVALSTPDEVFLVGFDSAVAHPLGVVARHHQLHGGEELRINPSSGYQVLVDTFRDRDSGSLEFNDIKGNAVDIEHQIRPFLMLVLTVTSFGYGESRWPADWLPVDQARRSGSARLP